MNTPRLALTALGAAALLAPAAAHASASGPGAYHVCTKSSLVERAPGNRPIGVVFKGMTFHVTSSQTATTHPSTGPALRWVKGFHTTSRKGKTFKTVGWVREKELAKGC